MSASISGLYLAAFISIPAFSIFLFYFYYVCVYVCMHMYFCGIPPEISKGCCSPEVGVTGSCELPMCDGNYILVLCKSSKHS